MTYSHTWSLETESLSLNLREREGNTVSTFCTELAYICTYTEVMKAIYFNGVCGSSITDLYLSWQWQVSYNLSIWSSKTLYRSCLRQFSVGTRFIPCMLGLPRYLILSRLTFGIGLWLLFIYFGQSIVTKLGNNLFLQSLLHGSW